MIQKLRTECGCQFTSKLDGMFKDIAISATLNDEFKQRQHRKIIDLSMKVLTTGYWPSGTPPAQVCQLPPTAQAAFEEFKMFYLNRHTGRQLTLQGNMGDADLKAIFYGKKKEPEDAEAASTSQPIPQPKEKVHILSVSQFYA